MQVPQSAHMGIMRVAPGRQSCDCSLPSRSIGSGIFNTTVIIVGRGKGEGGRIFINQQSVNLIIVGED